MDQYTEDCQQMLRESPSCSGWLRTKNILHKCGDVIGKNIAKLSEISSKITNKKKWDRQFVVFFDGVIFVFKDETSKKAEKRFRLNEFRRVEPIKVDKKDVPWPFRLVKTNGDEEVFSAMSEDEQQKWLQEIEKHLIKRGDADSDSDSYESPNGIGGGLTPQQSMQKISRGPLPSIPNPSLSIYDDPDEFDNDREKSASLHSTNNNKFNNVNTSNSNTSEKVPGCIKSSGIFIPLLPINSSNGTGKKAPDIISKVPPDNRPITSHHKGAPPPPPSTSNQNGVSSNNKKIPPIPPVAPKPTGKIFPQLKKLTQKTNDFNEIYESGSDQLPYELDPTPLTKKAMWDGLPAGATSIMNKLQQHEGAFLLRSSSQGSGYTMHVICSNSSKKFSIKEEPEVGYNINGISFKTLEDLLNHFMNNDLPSNDVRLGKSYSELISRN